MPFPQHTGPPWHCLTRTQAPTSFDYAECDVWANFVICRDLPLSLHEDDGNKSKCGVEIYLPNLVSRQFGLVQYVPFPFLETHNRQLIPQWKLTEAHSSDVAVQFDKAKESFGFCSFNFSDASGDNFNFWWQKYIESWDQVGDRIAPKSFGRLVKNISKPSPQRGTEMKRKLDPQIHVLQAPLA
ncbi:hypothetical protein ACH5RR_029043 [Cinchona calisaya]|uniref:Uncharacterized protein n=1 Tax=Cinchona calisaya TaxID=153742 RepID=A0ABD2YUZ9_9GENT